MDTKKCNKTTRVKEYILDLIEQQQLPANGRLPTEKELCELFQISRVPVHTALSELQEENIVTRIKGSGTYVKPAAKEEKGGNLVPFVLSESKSSYRFLESVRGAESALKGKNHYLTIHYCQENFPAEREMLRSLADDGFRSIILSPHTRSGESNTYYYELARRGIELTFIDLVPNGVTGNLVSCDHVLGGYQAAHHLIQNGYRRIAVLYDDLSIPSIYQRLQGYIFAMQEAGLAVPREYLCPFINCNYPLHRVQQHFHGGFTDVIKEIIRHLLALPEPPNALFCSNDIAAITAYHAMKEMGLSCPETFALIGFDNIPETKFRGLSTVEQPFYDIGYHAASLCVEQKLAPFSGKKHIALPPRVIPRASTAPKEPARP